MIVHNAFLHPWYDKGISEVTDIYIGLGASHSKVFLAIWHLRITIQQTSFQSLKLQVSDIHCSYYLVVEEVESMKYPQIHDDNFEDVFARKLDMVTI